MTDCDFPVSTRSHITLTRSRFFTHGVREIQNQRLRHPHISLDCRIISISALIQCWYNVGPPSATVGQRYTDTGSTSRDYRDHNGVLEGCITTLYITWHFWEMAPPYLYLMESFCELCDNSGEIRFFYSLIFSWLMNHKWTGECAIYGLLSLILFLKIISRP